MKILFFSYYFPPDIGAGSFRADSLINHLLQKNCSVTLICAQPNRYKNIKKKASSEIEIRGNLTIKRVPAPIFFQNLFGQALVFPLFIFKALLISRNEKPSLVIGTSSRLGTAFIAAISSIFHKADLVLDIRDIIIETISYSKIFKPLKKLIIFFLFLIEKLSVSKSSMLNLVSPAFNEYYINKYKYPINQIFNFQNGIDELAGKVYQRMVSREELESFKNKYSVISNKMVGGQPLIHIYSEQNPQDNFESVTPNLEDVFFFKIHASSLLV